LWWNNQLRSHMDPLTSRTTQNTFANRSHMDPLTSRLMWLLLTIKPYGFCWGNNQVRSHVDPLTSRRFNPQTPSGWVTLDRTSQRFVTTLHEEIISVPNHLRPWHIWGIDHSGPKDSIGHGISQDLLVWMERTCLGYLHLEGLVEVEHVSDI
jgi:hypothetical protein